MARGWNFGYSEPQSTLARLLHGGQAPWTRGGFDGETELIIAPEAPKAQSWLRGWGWMEARGGAGNVLGDTHMHRGQEAVNCYETSLLGGDLWDAGGLKSVIAVQSKHKMEGGP